MKSKKDPRLVMPGYEVYGEMRPIMRLWHWILGSLVLLVFGGVAWVDVPWSVWSLLFSVGFFVFAAVVFGFYLRRKWVPIGIKRDGERLLITGIFDSGILVASRVEFTSPTVLYVEREGERVVQKKLNLSFASTEDASKVADWLKSSMLQSDTLQLSG